MITNVFSKLPDEIRTEIFSRVPAKSVGKFRCLSKTWHNILSSPYFINLHLSRKTHQESLIFMTTSSSLHIIQSPIENPTISKKLELGNEEWAKVMSSCNGLVLMCNFKIEMVLINPITFEQFKIPKLTFDSNKSHAIFLLHGFGYDSSSHDYKILVASGSNGLFSTNNMHSTSVNLYSVKSGVWRSIDHSLYQFANSQNPCGVFTNGSIHWYDYHKKESKTLYKILAFNLTTEVFYELDIPSNATSIITVFVHEGHLCVLNPLWTTWSGRNGSIDIWMMKEYGMVNSWTKLARVDGIINGIWYKPLYFSRDKDIWLLMSEKTMVVFNLHEGTVKDMVVDGVLTSFHDGCSFVGSLVSLNGMVSSS